MGPECGYADLSRAFAVDPSLLDVAATLMGCGSRLPQPALTPTVELSDDSSGSSEPPQPHPPDIAESSGWPQGSAPAEFWLPNQYQVVVREPEEAFDREFTEDSWQDPYSEAPQVASIALWSAIVPRFRKAVATGHVGNRVAMDEVVKRVARGETIVRLPKQHIQRWGSRVQLVIDRSRHLMPFLQDQDDFRHQLESIYGVQSVEVGIFDESNDRIIPEGSRRNRFVVAGDGVPLVILGDFGSLADSTQHLAFWHELLHQITSRKAHAVAVVPCDPARIDQTIRCVVNILPWQSQALYSRYRDPSQRESCVRRMLAALACTSVIEPGLLRSIRTEVFGFGDASLESEFWLSSQLSNRHVQGAVIDAHSAGTHLADQFSELDVREQKESLRIVREWRQQRSEEVWLSEIWRLSEDAKKHIPERDCRIAEDRVQQIRSGLTAGPNDDQFSQAHRAWLARVTERLPDRVVAGNKTLRELKRLARPEDDRWLPGSKLTDIRPEKLRTLYVAQAGPTFTVGESPSAFPLVTSLQSSNGWVKCTPASDRNAFWKSGEPPEWASDWGVDDFGSWAEFELAEKDAGEVTTQRMRWIPPGTFRMGTDTDQSDVIWREVPHEVELTHGYWMFDVPVTQRLWQAVVGTKPSNFTGPTKPVDSVSWKDAQEFIDRLNALLDTSFVLPTAAQWEFACRAGTQTEFAFGDMLTATQARIDSDDGTTTVGSFSANEWGLYDMHGNVWEWCADWTGEFTDEKQVDPVGPAEGHSRVLRGGGWYLTARSARSACRSGSEPGLRSNSVGFRCAQVQDSAEPCEEGASRLAERRMRPTSAGEAAAQKVTHHQQQRFQISATSIVELESDLEIVQLKKMPKPKWATAMGCDQYGLWAEFEVGLHSRQKSKRGFLDQVKKLFGGQSQTKSPEAIAQRMRWISPGRFRMGSSSSQSVGDEQLVHDVTLTHGYWLFDKQVTQELWLAVTGETPSHFLGARRPVECVSWEDCQRFCEQLNRAVDGMNVCLPTEAEWEYACRAGTSTEFTFGDELTADQAHFGQAENSDGTQKVGAYDPNIWGLYDMHGNVWEWCQDWNGKYSGDFQVNPPGATEGRSRVLRGGSCYNIARYARSAYRSGYGPGYRGNDVGFRCAQVQEAGREASEGTAGGTSRGTRPSDQSG